MIAPDSSVTIAAAAPWHVAHDAALKALAAYNAGSAPVAACGCIPAIPETQAYVAKILGLLGGAGEGPATLSVRLVG